MLVVWVGTMRPTVLRLRLHGTPADTNKGENYGIHFTKTTNR